MTAEPSRSTVTAEELRRSFDRAFAEPPAPEPELENLVAVRVGDHCFAMRLAEIDGIEAGKALRALAVRRKGFLGISGIRGELVPVFSLAVLFGYPEDERERHWLALVGRDQPVGLSFSAFEGHLRVDRRMLLPLGTGDEHPYARQVLRHAETLRLVLDMPRIAAATRTQE